MLRFVSHAPSALLARMPTVVAAVFALVAVLLAEYLLPRWQPDQASRP